METTMTEVVVACPSCARPMGSINNSWQCFACHPIPEDIPICATVKCKKPLTRLDDPWNCWICLKCNDHPDVVNERQRKAEAQKQKKRPLLDERLTEGKVQELVDAAVAEALAAREPDYPPTRSEIQAMTATENINAKVVDPYSDKPETYLQKAKRLGVATHIPEGQGMRKKVEIMTDIEAKEAENVKEEIKAGQAPPGDDDEFARGLTADDMM